MRKPERFSINKGSPSLWPSPPRRGRPFSITAEDSAFGDFYHSARSLSPVHGLPVAQVGNLLYRRLAVGRRWERLEDCGLPTRLRSELRRGPDGTE